MWRAEHSRSAVDGSLSCEGATDNTIVNLLQLRFKHQYGKPSYAGCVIVDYILQHVSNQKSKKDLNVREYRFTIKFDVGKGFHYFNVRIDNNLNRVGVVPCILNTAYSKTATQRSNGQLYTFLRGLKPSSMISLSLCFMFTNLTTWRVFNMWSTAAKIPFS